MSIETLITDIYDVLHRKKHYDSLDMEEISRICGAFGSRISCLLYNRLTEDRGKKTLRMSNIGYKDSRLWHELNTQTPELVEGLEREAPLKFLYGDLTEELLLTLAEISGHKVERRQEECELEGIKGHIDAVIDDVLVDTKSASDYSFSKFERGDLGEDAFGYAMQLSAYSQATGTERAAFLVLNKTTGELCVLELKPEKRHDAAARIRYLKDILSKDTPPESANCCPVKEEDNGNTYLRYPCTYCPTKHLCHPGLRTFDYSDGPRYFTKVCKEPTRVKERGKEDCNRIDVC